jgi:predicted RNA-binding Zn ribbon-like protein
LEIMTTRHAAPGELEKVRAFVNTLDIENAEDELTNPVALRRWVHRAGLPAGGESTVDDLEVAIELREAMRSALVANHDSSLVPAEALAVLNRVARDTGVTLLFAPDRTWTTRVDSTGVPSALGTLVAIALAAMQKGTWPRLKVCANDRCRWAFYDHSRARTGRWCSMEVCGNRAKQSAWRSRH